MGLRLEKSARPVCVRRRESLPVVADVHEALGHVEFGLGVTAPAAVECADFGSVGDHERDIVPAKQQIGIDADAPMR